ncbi:MAG: DNA helicase RecG, partial [Chroococcidiopsidaceae cyanobacterium CP_BM_RX_35]|nr:DNA helicase RecG [Chroococcidiopsidaceae cyanobacterium CP_BM_RX_35]
MSTTESPDWVRLQKALTVEVERGFTDLVGKQYRFSEFLSLSFGKPPSTLPPTERRRWHEMAAKFASYPQLPLEERQHLLAETRRYLHQLQTASEGDSKPPRTTPLVQSNSAAVYRRLAPRLDQPLTSLAEVGAKKGEYLARLELSSVRDILFYYPRDHIDYARQVKIRELEAGETVTLIGTVKRSHCFSSPRNSKLTILELVIKDSSGQIRISRFFAGHRYSHRGWQEQQKRRYPVGVVVAASGLVKDSKYGLTLEDPEVEVLAHPGDPIDSLSIGRVVPVYTLADGVAADLVRQTVLAALSATVHLKDPLPATLRDKYGLIDLPVAISNIHFPADSAALELARRRLVFDEFFYLQVGLLQ